MKLLICVRTCKDIQRWCIQCTHSHPPTPSIAAAIITKIPQSKCLCLQTENAHLMDVRVSMWEYSLRLQKLIIFTMVDRKNKVLPAVLNVLLHYASKPWDHCKVQVIDFIWSRPYPVCSCSKYRLNPVFGFQRKGKCWERQSHMDSLVIPRWLNKNQPWAWKTSLLRGNPHSLCRTDHFVRRSFLLFQTQCVHSVLFKCVCVYHTASGQPHC